MRRRLKTLVARTAEQARAAPTAVRLAAARLAAKGRRRAERTPTVMRAVRPADPQGRRPTPLAAASPRAIEATGSSRSGFRPPRRLGHAIRTALPGSSARTFALFFSDRANLSESRAECAVRLALRRLELRAAETSGLQVDLTASGVRLRGTQIVFTANLNVLLETGEAFASSRAITVDAADRIAGMGPSRASGAAAAAVDRNAAMTTAVAHEVGAMIRQQIEPQIVLRQAVAAEPDTYSGAIESLGGLASDFGSLTVADATHLQTRSLAAGASGVSW